MRKPIIVGNWKMNKTISETLAFINEVDALVATDAVDAGLAVPFTMLKDAKSVAKNIKIAAQNCHFEESGAFTGEVSVSMLKELNLDYCVIGHSERRQMFNETDEAVNKKAAKLIASDILPIICVGETLEEFEAGKTEEVVRNSVAVSCANLEMEKVVIAYEPVWAIGTGKTATKEIANEVCGIVRNQIELMYGSDVASKVRIQYGGSVNDKNIKDLLTMEHIDGALVGGASLVAESYTGLIVNSK